jgi:hypothetical protein
MANSRQSVPGTNRSLPLGVIVIAAVGIVGALLELLSGLGSIGAGVGGLLGGSGLGIAVGVFTIMLAVVKLFVLVNLLRLKRWAWFVTVVVFGLDTLFSLVTLNVIGALFAGILLAYTYSVRGHFQ